VVAVAADGGHRFTGVDGVGHREGEGGACSGDDGSIFMGFLLLPGLPSLLFPPVLLPC
jgi:hypothetical protein